MCIRDSFAHLAWLIIPFGEADQADFYALDLHHLRLRIAIGHDAHGLHRGEGILIALFLKIARVVVGHVYGLSLIHISYKNSYCEQEFTYDCLIRYYQTTINHTWNTRYFLSRSVLFRMLCCLSLIHI